jgi:heme/copper-type cytochrome/quinol oxidase subunit 2
MEIILIIQTLILGITAWIVWRYTRETQRLREAAERQIEAHHSLISFGVSKILQLFVLLTVTSLIKKCLEKQA